MPFFVTVEDYVTRKMNRAVVNATEELQGYALACKAYPRSDLKVTAVGQLAIKKPIHHTFGFSLPATANVAQPEKEK